MEQNFKTENVLLKKEKLALNTEQLIENDLSLPDYCGDIIKILSHFTQTNIFSATVTGDKATVDGAVMIRIVYVNSSADTELYETSFPFNKSVDINSASDTDALIARCISEQISCRAVNPRRIDIRGSVTLKLTVCGTEECSFITDIPEDFCYTLKNSAQGKFLKCCAVKDLNVTEEGSSDDNLRNAKIVRCTNIPSVKEIKTIKNKMMVRGSVAVDTTLLTANGGFYTARVNIPVNHILDIEGIDEDSECCVNIFARSVDVRISPDSPSAAPHLEVSAILTVQANAFRTTEFFTIADVYSPSCELECDRKKINCISAMHRINENFTVSAKHEFSSCNISSICDVSVRKIRYTVTTDDNDIVIKGNLHFGMILLSDEGEKLCFERVSDFEFRKAVGAVSECEFNPGICLNCIDFSVDGKNTVNIIAELRVDGFAHIINDMNVVTTVNRGAEKACDTSSAVITVYFASKGERLWDIAKDHGTSVALIKSLNSVSDDTLDSDCMLVFQQE